MIDHNRLELIRAEVLDLTRQVGHFIKDQVSMVKPADILTKEHNSLVSYVDTTAEERLVEKLHAIIPEAGFITEEDTVDQNMYKELVWIIDPIDGTTNYLKGIPHYSTSIALQYNGEVVLGIINDIPQDTVYHTIKGHGAYANEMPLTVGGVDRLSEAIVVTGFPYQRDKDYELTFKLLEEFLRTSRGIRRLGSAALDLAYVASGKIDIYYEANLNIWDVAAGILLVQESGGIVSGYRGDDDYLMGKSLISTNTVLHPIMIETMNRLRQIHASEHT